MWLFVFSVVTVKAQLDLEHWFPPIYKAIRNPNSDYSDVYLYLSTPHKIPFKVDIYAANVIKESILLSKDNPYIFKIHSTDFIITSPYRLLQPENLGIHVAGENSFYASIRMDLANNQNEIITSKGKTAIGKLFYSCNIPSNIQDIDFIKKQSMITSIIATKDNTKVRISGYDPIHPKQNLLNFGGHNNPVYQIPTNNNKEFNFILNKGQSFSLVLWKINNFENPLDDSYNNFIGAKIEADKPVAINNGNYYGNMNDNYFEAERGKFVIDQSLPVKNLGKEYYFQKGFSSIIGEQDKVSEKFLIVATKNNTEIYLNDEEKPVKILNEGQYYINKEDFHRTEKFVNDGVFIKASEPIYAYQLTSGSDEWGPRGEPYAWQNIAFALIPPLDSKLPNEINYIPKVEALGDKLHQDVILQVITEKNKGLVINGTNIYNAQNIIGNDKWEYYRLNNQFSNLELSSAGPIIAGIIGGKFNGNGISTAGFYTGFSNDPYIIQNGNCIQESVFLTISNKDFEGFQWQKNGQNIIGATNDYYSPITPGQYTCILYYSGFQYITKPIEIKDCPNIISEKDIGSFCNEFIEIPNFSIPNQNIKYDKFEILASPLNGTFKFENNKLFYFSNGIEGTDRIVYKICTNNNSLCETFKINFSIYPKAEAIIKNEIIADDFTTYNLENAIVNSNKNNISYHSTFDYANNNQFPIINFNQYNTKENKIFIRIENNYGCYSIYKVDLKSLPPSQPSLIKLPNSFTPNDDRINDTWNFEIISHYQNLKINIFDKYGNIVFFNNDKNNSHWDGKDSSGRKLPTNSYWAIIQWEDPKTNKILNKSMWIYLKNR